MMKILLVYSIAGTLIGLIAATMKTIVAGPTSSGDSLLSHLREVDMINRIHEWLWRLLPDKCQRVGCCRLGVRGNENVINGQIICDYCYAKIVDDIADKHECLVAPCH
jgi:hypothetical protein